MRVWNLNSFNSDKCPENCLIRKSVSDTLDLDITGLAETHLRRCENIEIDGYAWFGNSRTDVHKKAPKGSGGLGVFICNCILNPHTRNKYAK